VTVLRQCCRGYWDNGIVEREGLLEVRFGGTNVDRKVARGHMVIFADVQSDVTFPSASKSSPSPSSATHHFGHNPNDQNVRSSPTVKDPRLERLRQISYPSS